MRVRLAEVRLSPCFLRGVVEVHPEQEEVRDRLAEKRKPLVQILDQEVVVAERPGGLIDPAELAIERRSARPRFE